MSSTLVEVVVDVGAAVEVLEAVGVFLLRRTPVLRVGNAVVIAICDLLLGQLLGLALHRLADVQLDAEREVELVRDVALDARHERDPRVEPDGEPLAGVEPHARSGVALGGDVGTERLLRRRERDRRTAADDHERLEPPAGQDLEAQLRARVEPEHAGRRRHRAGVALQGIRAGRRQPELELRDEPRQERARDPRAELDAVVERRVRRGVGALLAVVAEQRVVVEHARSEEHADLVVGSADAELAPKISRASAAARCIAQKYTPAQGAVAPSPGNPVTSVRGRRPSQRSSIGVPNTSA